MDLTTINAFAKQIGISEDQAINLVSKLKIPVIEDVFSLTTLTESLHAYKPTRIRTANPQDTVVSETIKRVLSPFGIEVLQYTPRVYGPNGHGVQLNLGITPGLLELPNAGPDGLHSFIRNNQTTSANLYVSTKPLNRAVHFTVHSKTPSNATLAILLLLNEERVWIFTTGELKAMKEFIANGGKISYFHSNLPSPATIKGQTI